MATFLVMYMKGDLLMERISLGALIIALCMLTDNAIIVIEGIKVGIESGRNKLEVVREVVAENQWPLFGATAIGVIAFAAIGLSEDSTGEYTNSLFWVILIALTLSWISSVTATPLLSYMFFKPLEGNGNGGTRKKAIPTGPFAVSGLPEAAHAGAPLPLGRGDRLRRGLRRGDLRFPEGHQSFFPPATRPQFMVDAFLPAGTHIRETEAFAGEIQRFIQTQPGVTHVTSFIGGGGLRFLLVYSPENENRAYVQFLVDVDDCRQDRRVDGRSSKNALDENYPERQRHRQKVPAGSRADGGRIQARFSGPDSAVCANLGIRP
jgi:multidrug efflux pump subunit AcrB